MGWGAILTFLLLTTQTDFGVRPAPSAEPATRKVTLNNAATFACPVASVTDGDTFRCRNGVRIRLS
jgi:endonuclease YncB( thermonuclease family)